MIYKQPPSWLAHHGVQGQKWGIKHGPPYPLDSGPSNSKSSNKSNPKIKSKDVAFNPNEIRDNDRLKKMALTGLMAMNNSKNYIDTFDPTDNDSWEAFKTDAFWFLYEDQTDLMPAIADLANKGYTAKQIRSYFDNAQKKANAKEKTITDPEKWAEWYYNDNEAFYTSEFWDGIKGSDYVEKCVDFVKNKTVTTADGEYPQWYNTIVGEAPKVSKKEDTK